MRKPWIYAALVGLVLGMAGCESSSAPSLLVPEGHTAESFHRSYRTSGAPATEEAAKRTLAIAQRIFDANTQMPVQPTIMTIGRPEREVFHDGYGGLNGSRVYITEGLINACKTDDQLAAVLCVQFGRIAAERAARAGSSEEDKGRLTIDERIGRESDRGFGPADGTRRMEIAKREQKARENRLKPDPTKCAEEYLRRANYRLQALLEVSAMLIEAEANEEIRDVIQPKKKTLPPISIGGPPASVPETSTPTGNQSIDSLQ
jgi:hypothetical protein